MGVIINLDWVLKLQHRTEFKNNLQEEDCSLIIGHIGVVLLNLKSDL